MKKRARILSMLAVFSAVLVFGFSGVSRAQVVQEYSVGSGQGKVDWEEGYVYATAVGSANMAQMVNEVQAESVARKTARHLALAALNETVNKVSIDAYATYNMEMMADDILKVETHGVLVNAHMFKEQFSFTGRGAPRAVVTVRIPIAGGLSRAVVPWAARKAKENPQKILAPPKAPPVKPPPVERYTGLIIDTSGTGVRPTLVPRVLTIDGKREVYGPAIADQSKAMVMSYAGYRGTVKQAKEGKRAGHNPLIVKAEKAFGTLGGDMAVSDEDAMKIIVANAKDKFLEACKVVIVVN